jgi:hypothetical protein
MMSVGAGRCAIFLIAARSVQVGMLKMVAASLQRHLDQPLRGLLM